MEGSSERDWDWVGWWGGGGIRMEWRRMGIGKLEGESADWNGGIEKCGLDVDWDRSLPSMFVELGSR